MKFTEIISIAGYAIEAVGVLVVVEALRTGLTGDS